MTAPSTHSVLSPSSASRWCKCPASIAMSMGLKEESSPFALEGSCAHAVAESMLTGEAFQAPKGAEDVNPDDFREEVRPYVDFVNGLKETYKDATVMIEQRLDISSITGEAGAFGTSDAVVVADTDLYVIDLKYGRGVEVEADHNHQLAIYAAAAIEQFRFLGEVKTAHMVIVQPRLNHQSTWSVPVATLMSFIADIREAAKEAIRETDAHPKELRFCPSAETCRFCRARGGCAALAKYALTAAGVDLLKDSDIKLNPEELAECLDKLPALDIWINAVRERAQADMQAGTQVPGWKLVKGRDGARKWADAKEAEKYFSGLGIASDLYHETSLISPTQAEKLVKQKVLSKEQWQKAGALITRAPGKVTIAPQSDKRPEVHSALTAEDFPDETKINN